MQTPIFGINADDAFEQAPDSSLLSLLGQLGRNGETTESTAIRSNIDNILRLRQEEGFSINDFGEKIA